MKNKLYYIILTATLAIAACEGPAGPQGPQVEAGARGEQGPVGTANIIYSDWILVRDLASSKDSVINNRNVKMYRIPAQDLTQEIIEEGLVMVYYRFGGFTSPLPLTLATSLAPVTITFTTPEPERITILIYRHDNGDLTTFGLSSTIQFRYVLIPGGIPTAQMAAGFWDDYEAVAEYFRIQD